MKEPVINRMDWAKDDPALGTSLVGREWLIANGLGGYASGTVAGVCTRRFHGLLTAALPSPLGRMMMLNHVSEEIRLPDGAVSRLGGHEVDEGRFELETRALAGFRLEGGLPVWRFEIDGVVVEKSIVLPHGQNTVFLRYRMLSGRGVVRLRVRPSVHFRKHEGRVDLPLERPYRVSAYGSRFEIIGDGDVPPLRLLVHGERASIILDGGAFRRIYYRTERSRGYDALGTLWSPGYVRADLTEGSEACLAASTEPWEVFASLDPDSAFATEHQRRARLLETAPPAAREGFAAELVLAADQFVIVPNVRVIEAARIRAIGDDVRAIIAGYHWFTDWGRDTMISVEGLLLATGRLPEAGYVLRAFGRYVRDGLIPNLFPEGRQEGVYYAADATLWFFHALGRFLDFGGDRVTLRQLLPILKECVRWHVDGTRYGIHLDPADGLLAQGDPSYPLTWMDAKMPNWIVTPRRGKAVEINALWYNALKLLEGWVREEEGESQAAAFAGLAARARDSFNRRFWDEERGALFDVLDGEPADAARVRPNQILAVSLPHAVLDEGRWGRVVELVRRELLTPYGLRSLARGDADYRSRYDGDLKARDGAYHQGTVWSWLIGPYVDAWLKVHPEDRAGGRRLLEAFPAHLGDACLGSVSEIFDAEPPYAPRGCVAQAWGVAEVLRAWLKVQEPA